ncbi:MAG: hypothetical protein WCJ29_03180 [bacterium]
MAKRTCEASRALSITFLKEYGYFDWDLMNGTATWTSSWSEDKSSIGIESRVRGDFPHLRLHYVHTSYDGETTNLDYQVRITSTPCYFGGKRYWFICPLIRNGVPCQRQVGVIYGAGMYYGCRYCYDLAYQSQQENHSGMWYVMGKVLSNDLYDKEAEMRVKYWHGRPTKRYARLLRKANRTPSTGELMAAEMAFNKLLLKR